jgi:hypothetical protein
MACLLKVVNVCTQADVEVDGDKCGAFLKGRKATSSDGDGKDNLTANVTAMPSPDLAGRQRGRAPSEINDARPLPVC